MRQNDIWPYMSLAVHAFIGHASSGYPCWCKQYYNAAEAGACVALAERLLARQLINDIKMFLLGI